MRFSQAYREDPEATRILLAAAFVELACLASMLARLLPAIYDGTWLQLEMEPREMALGALAVALAALSFGIRAGNRVKRLHESLLHVFP